MDTGNPSKSEPTKKEEFQASEQMDTINIDDAKLSFGFWYISHLTSFKKAIIFIFFAISVITWGYSLFNFVYYLAFGAARDDKMLNELVRVGTIGHSYFTQRKAASLEISEPEIIFNKDKKYDLAAAINNPNKYYWAEFDYQFVSGANIIYEYKGYIMPNEDKYLLSLSNGNITNDTVELNIGNISWHRIDQKEIRDISEFEKDHTRIEIKDKQFIGSGETSLSDKLSISRLKFTAVNRTPYNYRNIKFNIILRRGGGLAAADNYTIDEFISGQTYPVEISLKGDQGFVNEIEIQPDINYMENSSYIRFESKATAIPQGSN
jgi:hypothetical protein